jgi:CMP-N-acetylneuraminic acid synthetase
MHNTNKTKSDDYVNKFKYRINKIIKYKFLNKYKNHKLLKNILIIIPARGGSKRLKNKNLYAFRSKPMIYWAINAAQKTIFKNNLYVSSENKKILEISQKFGAKSINRPINLSKDSTFKIDAIRHAVEAIEKKTKKRATLVMSLQANSPEIQSTNIDEIITHLIKFKLQEVISVDKNNNSNAALRLMLRKAVFQKSLSTYVGFVYTDTIDIHTLKDIQKIYKKDENK